MMQQYQWLEIWVDSHGLDYFLLAKCRPDDSIELYDLNQNCRQIKVFSTYAELTLWMLDEEYDLITGRTPFD